MKEERQRYVRRYESAGEAQAKAIEERAKASSDQIIAFAERQAQSIRSEGDRAAVAWFTGARATPSVRLAFSDDSGATFGDPIVVEEGSVIGRVVSLPLGGRIFRLRCIPPMMRMRAD